MEFNLQTLYEQIFIYGEYIGKQSVKNEKGLLVLKIINIKFDNKLFVFYFERNREDLEFILTKCEIKKL